MASKSRSLESPKDPSNLVWIIFCWLGIACLLPWNFFITVQNYWMHKFRDVNRTETEGYSQLQTEWGSYLSIASMVPNVTSLILNAAIGHRFRILPRLVISLIIIIALFLFCDIMALVNTDSWQSTFLVVTLFIVVLININVAIFQGGLSGLAGMFPPKYMSAVIEGQAIGGVFATMTNVIFLACGADDVLAAFLSFAMAVIFLCTALVGFFLLRKSEFFKFYAGNNTKKSEVQQEMLTKGSEETEEEKVDFVKIIKRIWIWMSGVFLCFLVTLAVFPALTAIVKSSSSPDSAWGSKYFIPVGCFLVFNMGDYVGRVLAGHIQWPKATNFGSLVILGFSLSRFVFFPLFLFCNINPGNRTYTKVYFTSDFLYLVFMAIFSISNGYIGNISMMFAPKMLKNSKEQMTAASIMVTCLVLGLAIGASLSSLCVKLL